MYEFIKEGPNRIIQQAPRSTSMKGLFLDDIYTCSIEQGLSGTGIQVLSGQGQMIVQSLGE